MAARHPAAPPPTTDTRAAFADALERRPQRSDARRNYEALLEAARDVFATNGSGAALEEIARRANVGIGTLYRHFPTRQDLFEAVYVHEVEHLCQAADDVTALDPWDGLVAWLRRFVEYTATKRAIVEELAKGSPLFQGCRAEIVAAGGPLLRRAQQSGAARDDISFDDLLRLISGITMHPFTEPEQLDRVLGVAIDGIRRR
jgi:AcrR family transcriptional regulator